MAPINVFENGLNVQYVPDFIAKEEADSYFDQLRTLPYYCATIKNRGKSVKSKRLVLAYGDENLSYVFNGTFIQPEPWNPLMLELRTRVEKLVDRPFNYVLLNLYTDGSSYSSQHKVNESRVDPSFPIIVLSFGAERTIVFKKPHTTSTNLKLTHGSLYTLLNPTNKMFTHGIPPELVNDMNITLTFLHLLPNPFGALMKKPRLQDISSDNSVSTISYLPSTSNSACEKDVSSFMDLCEQERDFSSTDEFYNLNDLLSNPFQQKDTIHPLLKEWNLGRNTFFKIVVDLNFNLRLHIRHFNEPKCGVFLPSKQGIVMTTNTWNYFLGKIQNFKFNSVNDSFICNNQLLFAYIDKEYCMLQQIYRSNFSGFFLKPAILILFKDQILKLLELTVVITESIIQAIFIVQLPKLILNESVENHLSESVCFSHLNKENAREYFFNCITSEIIRCTNMIECEDCLYTPTNQSTHACAKPVLERFNLNKHAVLLNLNLFNIIKKLRNMCMCHYDTLFLKQIDMKSYEECIEEILADHENKN